MGLNFNSKGAKGGTIINYGRYIEYSRYVIFEWWIYSFIF